MEPDRLRPAMAINKEIELRFVVGYTPQAKVLIDPKSAATL